MQGSNKHEVSTQNKHKRKKTRNEKYFDKLKPYIDPNPHLKGIPEGRFASKVPLLHVSINTNSRTRVN